MGPPSIAFVVCGPFSAPRASHRRLLVEHLTYVKVSRFFSLVPRPSVPSMILSLSSRPLFLFVFSLNPGLLFLMVVFPQGNCAPPRLGARSPRSFRRVQSPPPSAKFLSWFLPGPRQSRALVPGGLGLVLFFNLEVFFSFLGFAFGDLSDFQRVRFLMVLLRPRETIPNLSQSIGVPFPSSRFILKSLQTLTLFCSLVRLF